MKRTTRSSWVLPALAAAVLSGPPRASAFMENSGGSPAQFLQIGPGARSQGMGDAYSAVADGPDALYWNSAGMALMRRPAFSYTRSEPVSSVHHDFAAYAHPVKALRGTLGVSLTYMSQDALPVVTNTNLVVGKFSPHSESLSIGYAVKFQSGETRTAKDYFGENWNVPGLDRPFGRRAEPWTGTMMAGAAVKVVRESYYLRDATAFAFDLGALFRPSYFKGLSMSLAVRNAGERMRFISKGWILPAEMDAGAAYERSFKNGRLLTAAGLIIPYFGPPEGRVGLEYSLRLTKTAGAAVRLGYKTRTTDGLGPVTGVTAGVGVSVNKASVDVGFQPMGMLGVGYKVSLGYRF